MEEMKKKRDGESIFSSTDASYPQPRSFCWLERVGIIVVNRRV